MMKNSILSLFLLSGLVCGAQSYSGPESAEYDYANHRWLIANTSSHQVIARSSGGVLSNFVSGLVSGPYGIEIVGDTLFCCSGASIKGYLLSTAAQVYNLNIGATFLNGLTHDDSGNLIATDFTGKKIYKINITAQTFTAIGGSLSLSPNGIIFDSPNNRCVFVNWGSNAPISAINMTTNMVSTVVPTTMSNCDGITRDGQGRYYVSAWGSQSVVRYDSAFMAPSVSVVPGLSNPADIFYNVVEDTLAIPNAGNNTVTYFGFVSPVSIAEQTGIEFFEVYPNPILYESEVRLKLNQQSFVLLYLMDMQGRIQKSWYFEGRIPGEELRFPIYASEFAPGFYQLLLVLGEKRKTVPFIVQ